MADEPYSYLIFAQLQNMTAAGELLAEPANPPTLSFTYKFRSLAYIVNKEHFEAP